MEAERKIRSLALEADRLRTEEAWIKFLDSLVDSIPPEMKVLVRVKENYTPSRWEDDIAYPEHLWMVVKKGFGLGIRSINGKGWGFGLEFTPPDPDYPDEPKPADYREFGCFAIDVSDVINENVKAIEIANRFIDVVNKFIEVLKRSKEACFDKSIAFKDNEGNTYAVVSISM